MVFSNTTDKNGGIQTMEFWTGLGDAGISGDSTLLKVMTSRVNASFDSIMPKLLSFSDTIRWDDTNHTDLPIGTLNLVSGQVDYTVAEDDNSLDILNLTNVRILQSATDTEYVDLQRIYIDDPLAPEVMSPNPSNTGIPSHYLERGNTIFLYPEPNYSATAGIKLFFEREQSYFASTDTTKEPGIPKPFHELLFLMAALDWLLVNKPESSVLITRLELRIREKQIQLDNLISARNPMRPGITMKGISHR